MLKSHAAWRLFTKRVRKDVTPAKRMLVGASVVMGTVLGFSGVAYAVLSPAPAIDQRIYVAKDGGSWNFDATTWDGIKDSATQGTDANGTNGTVRAQDTISYMIELSVNERDATNVVATVTLSDGQRWPARPGICKTSGVSPGSSISGDGKTLVCNVGALKQGTKLDIEATALVNSAKNGDILSASVSSRADGATALPATKSGDVKATALFGIDAVNTVALSPGKDSGPTGEAGQIQTTAITVRLKQGSELPVNQNQVLTFNFPTSNSPLDVQLLNWNNNVPCADTGTNIGTISCSVGANNTITVTLSNINYLAAASPLTALYSFKIQTWIPNTDAQAAPGMSLAYTTAIAFSPLPVSQNALLSNGNGTETNTVNNTVNGAYLASAPGSYCSSLTADGYANYGCGSTKSGTGQVTNGSYVVSAQPHNAVRNGLTSNEVYNAPTPLLDTSRVKCYKIDHRYFDYIRPSTLAEFNSQASTGLAVYGANNNPAINGRQIYSAPITGGNASSLIPQPIVEYSTTPITATDAGMQAQKCDSSMTWQDYTTNSPANPSVMTALRIRYTPGMYITGASNYNLVANFVYKINTTFGTTPMNGDKFPIYAHTAAIDAAGATYTATQDTVYDSDMSTVLGYTDRASATFAFNNYNITHLNYVSAEMLVAKTTNPAGQTQLQKNADGTIQPVGYTITPTINGAQAAVTGQTFTIQDELPTHPTINPVAVLVPGSVAYIDPSTGHNGDYAAPVQKACVAPGDTAKQCLVWTLTNVDTSKALTAVHYSLQPATTLVTAKTFTNNVYITASSAGILGKKQVTVGASTVQYSDASVNVTMPGSGGYYIYKTDDLKEYNVNAPDDSANYPVFTLHYQNESVQDFTRGILIDVLPFNSDTKHGRYNTFAPTATYASRFTDTSAKKSPGLAAAPQIPAGATLHYLVYDANNQATFPENISQDPCASTNLAAGFDPLTDPTNPCYRVRWNGGANTGTLPGGGTAGTGQTPWTATAPSNLNDVVAFRVSFGALPQGSASQSVSYAIKPTGNHPDDYYCNNFSSRVTEISLEVRSNTVCAHVRSAKTTELSQTGINTWYIMGATLSMIVAGVGAATHHKRAYQP